MSNKSCGRAGGPSVPFRLSSYRFSLLAAATRKSSSARRAEGRLFRMQIWWLTGLRRVSLEPTKKIRAARQAARNDVADKCLAFHDRDIRFARNRNQIIGSVTAQWTGCPEMKWNCDLMHRFSVQIHRANAPADERASFNRAAQAHNANVIAIVDLQLGRQFWRDFDEHLRVPPDKFFAFAPWLTVRLRAGAIINDAAIAWPTEAPAVAEIILRLTRVGFVYAV